MKMHGDSPLAGPTNRTVARLPERIAARLVLVTAVVLSFLPAARAENGVSDDKIKIGMTTALTGATSARPKKLLEGHKLYFDKVNAAGGVNGRQIGLTVLDDKYDPQLTSENAGKLINESKVFALFKIYGTPTIRAILPMAEKADVPIVAPSSGDQDLRTTLRKNVFLVKAGYFGEAELMVDALLARNIKKIAILYQDDTFGNDGRNGTLKALSAKGLKLVAEGTYKRNTTDIDAALDIIEKAKPEAVMMWTVPAPAIAFVKKANDRKFKPVYMGNSSLSVSDYMTVAQSGFQATGVPLPESDFAIAKEYRETAQKKGEAIDPAAFEGYVDAAVLVAGLRLAGKDLTRQSFRTALESMHSYDLGGLHLTFSATDHQGLERPFLSEIKNGKLVPAN